MIDRLRRHERAIRLAAWSLLVCSLFLIARGLPLEHALGLLETEVAGQGVAGGAVFALAYAVLVCLLVPGSWLTLLAGAVYGPLVGTVVVSLGATTGATLAFLLARHVARDAVARVAARRPRFGAIDGAIAEGGWKVVGLLRLAPIVPFSLGNYLFGLTGVGLVPYVLATWLGALPGTFLYVGLGHAGGRSLAGEARGPAGWALLVGGLVAAAGVSVWLARTARRRLRALGTGGADLAEGGPPLPPPGPPRPARTLLLAGVALLLAGTAIATLVRPALLAGLLGPPPVTMREAYARRPGGPRFDHRLLDELLREHVDAEGLVHYAGLARDARRLDAYLASLAVADFGALGRDEKLAFLVNAYNACTLRLILDHLPLASIRDIPSERRWEGRTWTLGGRALTLAQIEHDELRRNFVDPRIHFAINCASIGCPPLRDEAYVGARIDAQLREQCLLTHRRPRWLRLDGRAGPVHLTRIYQWYAGDFEAVAGSVAAFAARFSPPLAEALEAGSIAVRWLPYDWSLNDRDTAGR